MADIETTSWSETAASNNSATPDGWPEGQLPSSVNNCAREGMGAVKREWNRSHPTVTSGGAANVQTLTYTTAPAAYVQGQTYTFIAGFTNTGSVTLNVNGLGAKAVTKNGTTALSGGEIKSGAVVTVFYDGTRFQLTDGGIGILSVVEQSFVATGTYTPTVGMIFCLVRAVGGGGAGGGTAAVNNAAQAAVGVSGQAGAYSEGLFTAATVGASQAVTIGAGGTAGTAGANPGNAGGTTSLGALLTAVGGAGGSAGTATAATLAANGNGNTTTGTGGFLNVAGAPSAQSFVGGPVACAASANGACSMFGQGGLGIFVLGNTATAGTAATGNGSAGSGAAAGGTSNAARAGGAGTLGRIEILEFCAQ